MGARRKGCLGTGFFEALANLGGLLKDVSRQGVIVWLLALLPLPGRLRHIPGASPALHLGAAHQELGFSSEIKKALPLTSCVPLDETYALSEPQSAHLQRVVRKPMPKDGCKGKLR